MQPSSRVTIRDVAARAGVSVATVSKVINERYGVSAATLARVRAVIEELGYEASLVAQSLRNHRTNVIGILVADLEPFSTELLKGAADAIRGSGFELVVYSAGGRTSDQAIDASELAALETAAGVIGAALHRERLVDDVRRERERAAEERVAGLAKANAVIRANLERPAGPTDLHSLMGHMLLEATRQLDAVSGAVIVLKDSLQQWRIVAHVRDGQPAEPPFAASVPVSGSAFTAPFAEL